MTSRLSNVFYTSLRCKNVVWESKWMFLTIQFYYKNLFQGDRLPNISGKI